MKKKKAVYVSVGIFPFGRVVRAPEIIAQQNLAALSALGFDTTIITTPDDAARPKVDYPLALLEPMPPEIFINFHAHWRYRRNVARVVARELSDPSTLLFCEHWPALLCCPRHARTVYSCHDLESKLTPRRRMRKKTPITFKTRLYWRLVNWLEDRMFRRASRAICHSASEATQVHAHWHLPAEYIPPVIPRAPATLPPAAEFANLPLRFWFFGSSGATANKIMLDHLMAGAFDQLQAAVPAAEFHQLGSIKSYTPGQLEWLKKNFTLHGFVEDISKVFNPGDFCLIPYQEDTGFRTKIPEACSYGMISAGYHISFACCPEMRAGYNCVMAAGPGELAQKLALVCADSEARRKLAAGAIETVRQEFSFANLLERYRRALDFNNDVRGI